MQRLAFNVRSRNDQGLMLGQAKQTLLGAIALLWGLDDSHVAGQVLTKPELQVLPHSLSLTARGGLSSACMPAIAAGNCCKDCKDCYA